MALWLLYRSASEGGRNNGGIHSALADAADEASARALVNANRHHNNPNVTEADWTAVQIADTATLPGAHSVLLVEGDVITLRGCDRGGNRVPAPMGQQF